MSTKYRTRAFRRPAKLAAVVCAASLAFVACGDDDDAGPATTAPSPATDAPADTGASSSSAPDGTEGSSSADDAAWEEVLAAANEEGEIEVWSVLNTEHMAKVEAAFESAYPEIDLVSASLSPPDIDTRVDAEQASGVGTVDVLLHTDRVWHQAHVADGYFAEIIAPEAFAADEALRNGKPPTADGAPVATQVLYDDNTRLINLVGPWGYAWNADAVDGDPTFESLFADDTYKDRIGIIDPANSPINVVLYGIYNERYPGFFDRLGELNVTLFPRAGAVGEALAAGAIDVAPGISGGAVVDKPNLGFAFDEGFPVPATAVYSEVLASSESPNAAQVFVNWLMTPEGQEVWCEGYGSVLPDISTAFVSMADVEMFDAEAIDPAEVEATMAALNKALGR